MTGGESVTGVWIQREPSVLGAGGFSLWGILFWRGGCYNIIRKEAEKKLNGAEH